MNGLVLDLPQESDVDDIVEIFGDPRVWTHFPSGRFTQRSQAEGYLADRIAGWESDGLGTWMVRQEKEGRIIGVVGCSVRRAPAEVVGGGSKSVPDEATDGDAADGRPADLVPAFWNLGYRFRPEAQGKGFAHTVSRAALEKAAQTLPDLPIVAYLVEHNIASGRLAQKLGLDLRYRGPDVGNPDPNAIRLVYADRELSPGQLAATLR